MTGGTGTAIGQRSHHLQIGHPKHHLHQRKRHRSNMGGGRMGATANLAFSLVVTKMVTLTALQMATMTVHRTVLSIWATKTARL
jgi:hypothetical protein